MEERGALVAMASETENTECGDQTVPDGDEGGSEVKAIQSHYLRCPSPTNFSTLSESRFSMISGSDADSIFMEPIHLSSAIAAKQIINEELPSRGVRAGSVPESMLETAEELMVEDLYNRVRDMIDDRSPYNTPCVLDIQRALIQDRMEAPINPVDEVWPNIFIAEKSVAVNKARLKRMGITHVLNAAHGTGVYTSETFYSGMSIQYMGIEVDDFTDSVISPHFRTTAEFLDEALLTHKGKVLVVSMMGMSRSAILVASYLMIFQHMTIMEALTALRKKRAISPNEGFLKQLREFNETLMEERDDDDETLSQCSVIDARARARIFGNGAVNDDDDDEEENTEEEEEERSMMGVKAHSIMMEEEEDGASVMSSVASSAASVALKSGWTGVPMRPGNPGMTELPGELILPGQEGAQHREEEDDGVGSMIREWQQRNEKYQSEEWWEAQLNSDGDDELSLMREQPGRRTRGGTDADLDSVTSEDVQAVKERMKRRPRRPPSDTMSTSSCTSYADLWKQRLREIEEQAAARYHAKDEDGDGESTATEEGVKKIDEDLESILSDSSSMYNFCQKNKEKLTPLERWRVKRIQFGWNKKDGEDGEKSSVGGENDGEEQVRTPALEDVNLTAYQTWKLKQQRRYGQENKDEVLEISRGEDSATAKRRQRREELLERSRKTLEESQSMCGWEAESCVSGGTIPLSAFWAGAGVAGPPTIANDDNMSMLSGRSSVISSVSQARSNRSTLGPPPPITPVPPIVPVPTVQGPGGEPMVNLASIQNWIANVVSETLAQKQSEMSLPPPSRAGSLLSYGGGSSVALGHGVDDDKASMLSGASYSSVLSHGQARRTESILSEGSSSDVSGLTGLASRRSKITTTSVPLYSLFRDQVDLHKLDSMDQEMKTEMRGKMAAYEKKKILEDNKRSTLYKKKKPKEEDNEEEERKRNDEEFLMEKKKKAEKTTRSYGLSGCLNLNPALEKEKNTSIDDWLKSVRPPPRKPADGTEPDPLEGTDDDIYASASEFDFSGRMASYTIAEEEEEEEGYSVRSGYRSRIHADSLNRDVSPEHFSWASGSPQDTDFVSSRFKRATRSHELSHDGTESYNESISKTRSEHRSRYESNGTEGGRSRREETEDEEDDEVAAFIAQTRQRIRSRSTTADYESDEVLAAWRAQQETKSQGRNES